MLWNVLAYSQIGCFAKKNFWSNKRACLLIREPALLVASMRANMVCSLIRKTTVSAKPKPENSENVSERGQK